MSLDDQGRYAEGNVGTKRQQRKTRTTARQSCWAADSALVRSEPEQAPSMQLVTELTNEGDLQRHESSRGSQLPKSAFARQDCEQSRQRRSVSMKWVRASWT